MKKFRTLNLAIEFYHQCQTLKLQKHLRDQLLRASSSISLNLGEGSAKPTRKDQMKFYNIAFGSLRECQVILQLAGIKEESLLDLADHIGASLYKLTRSS